MLHHTPLPKAKEKSIFLNTTCNKDAPIIPRLRQTTTKEDRKNMTLQRKRQDGMLTSERIHPPKKGGKQLNLLPTLLGEQYNYMLELLQRYNYATVVRDGRQILYATLGNNLNLVAAYTHLNEFVSNNLSTLLGQSLVV